MAVVKRIVCAFALLIATPAGADEVPDASVGWGPYVAEAAQRFGLPPAWIWRVMAIESRGRTTLGGRPIRSPKGAIGLMQLMPATWVQMRNAYALGSDPDDPRDNITAGTAYLRAMYDRFGYPGLFAAYNAGPARYAAVLAGSTTLPRETRDYLARAASETGGAATRVARPVRVSPPLFAIERRSTGAPPGSPPDAPALIDGLFAIRRD